MQLVEGEAVVRVLRPHPLAVLPRYAPAAYLAALSAGAYVLFASDAWRAFLGRDGPATAWALAAAVVALPILAAGWIAFWRLRSRLALALWFATAAAVALAAPLTGPAHALAFPIALSGAALAALAHGELARRAERCVVTNYRLVLQRGWPAREERSIRFPRLLDLEVRPLPLVPVGALVVRLDSVREEIAGGPAQIRGVVRPQRERDRILALARKSAPPAYLGDKGEQVRRVEEILRH
ncbi:MAG TPA: hypothetical protein VM681_00970 [Candidatus Thermoplasmatota archaeon]|nr:hypothetical protein [Candidatus Thermoplasmatota archaeon]